LLQDALKVRPNHGDSIPQPLAITDPEIGEGIN
jgi:hypothetical protein